MKNRMSETTRWTYNDAYDFVNEAWGETDSLSRDYDRPADNDFGKLANEIMSDTDTTETILNFSAGDLAVYLDENANDIWK